MMSLLLCVDLSSPSYSDSLGVDDVTARSSKIHGEFVRLKQRPLTSRAVCYRIELAAAKTFMPRKTSQISQLDIQTILPKIFPLKTD